VFKWEGAVEMLKNVTGLVQAEGGGLTKQVVIANIDDLNEDELFSARTVFGLAGGYTHFYRYKTFEQAAREFDKEIQEAVGFFNESRP
jgi:hypothetical protein